MPIEKAVAQEKEGKEKKRRRKLQREENEANEGIEPEGVGHTSKASRLRAAGACEASRNTSPDSKPTRSKLSDFRFWSSKWVRQGV